MQTVNWYFFYIAVSSFVILRRIVSASSCSYLFFSAIFKITFSEMSFSSCQMFLHLNQMKSIFVYLHLTNFRLSMYKIKNIDIHTNPCHAQLHMNDPFQWIFIRIDTSHIFNNPKIIFNLIAFFIVMFHSEIKINNFHGSIEIHIHGLRGF